MSVRGPTRPCGPSPKAPAPRHRRRRPPREDEPAALEAIPLGAGGAGARRDGGGGARQPRRAGRARPPPVRRALGFERHHPRYEIHDRPLRIRPILHPQAPRHGSGVEGSQGDIQRRLRARRGGAQDHVARARPALPGGVQSQFGPRPARIGCRSYHARARHARGALLHIAGGGFVRTEVGRVDGEEEGGVRIRDETKNVRRGRGERGHGTSRELQQAVAEAQRPSVEGVPRERIRDRHPSSVQGGGLLRTAGRRHRLPVLLRRERFPAPPPEPGHTRRRARFSIQRLQEAASRIGGIPHGSRRDREPRSRRCHIGGGGSDRGPRVRDEAQERGER
mmetsp:Transcript_6747/g.16596  ORF Transcript_6747/g.16596 Transcript_6747/m.16596 type:complete len:336 (-) Transcript_6747:2746-3753(-)